MSTQANSPDLFSAISSPASASGASPCAKPVGPTTCPSGPAVAPVNLSARQAKAAGLLTSGTCGPHSTGLSNSAVLQSSLASRLHQKTALLGSTLYRLTWKRRAMPSGRSIPALRASALRISGSGSTGWPTPTTKAKAGGEYADPAKAQARALGPHANDLRDFVQMAAWPTPCQQDGPKGGPSQGSDRLPGAGSLAATPTTRDWKDGSDCPNVPVNALLGRTAWAAGWTTPQAHDTNGRSATQKEIHGTKHGCACLTLDAQKAIGPARLTASGKMLTGCAAQMASGGQLHPAHSLWLQLGPFATAWASCGERVMPSTSRKRKASSKP